MRNLHASTPLFTDVHGPWLHEGTSKHEKVLESLTVYVSLCTILFGGLNICTLGQALRKVMIKINLYFVMFYTKIPFLIFLIEMEKNAVLEVKIAFKILLITFIKREWTFFLQKIGQYENATE